MTPRSITHFFLVMAAALATITTPISPALADPGTSSFTDSSVTQSNPAPASGEVASVPAGDSDGLVDISQRSPFIDCSKRPVWPEPVTEEGKRDWLIWWNTCPTIWMKGGFASILMGILPSSSCTNHRLPDHALSNLWCTTCANPDPVQFFECMRGYIFSYIGTTHIRNGEDAMNCNDISAIFQSTAGYCPGLTAQIECASFEDSTGQEGHCWNFSTIVTPEGDLCFMTDISNNIVIAVPCPKVHSPVVPVGW